MLFNYQSFKMILAALVALVLYPCSSKAMETQSPNGKINLSVQVENTNSNSFGDAVFIINYNDGNTTKNILSGAYLSMETDRQTFRNLKLLSASKSLPITENYQMITGKKSHCTNEGVERTYRFQNEQQQTLHITFRVYNEGITFRYTFDAVNPDTEYITNELTTYPIPDGTKRWIQQICQ